MLREEDVLEDGETPSGLTVPQKLSNLANRCLHSRNCSFFYILMILLNLFLIGWVIVAHGYPTHWSFLVFEISNNLALVAEIVVKMFAQKRNFFTSKANWYAQFHAPLVQVRFMGVCCTRFDVVVAVLCVASLGLYFGGPSTLEEIDDTLSIFFLVFRYSVQFLRLLHFIKNNQQKRRSSKTGVILLDGDSDDNTHGLDQFPASPGDDEGSPARSATDSDNSDPEEDSATIGADSGVEEESSTPVPAKPRPDGRQVLPQ